VLEGTKLKYQTTCDRCGGHPPLQQHFWIVRSHILCDDCNAQWAAFRWVFAETLLEWCGQVVVDQKRRPTKFRF
jgi:hypothetical protein